MTRFADTHTRLTDDHRVRVIRDHEAKRIDRQFAPIKAKAQANLTSFQARRTWALY
jgi:hypothetical protein